MRRSQDWRDFNVHCATLNFFIARFMQNHVDNKVIITGDFMNEVFADYTSETVDGVEFYKQIRADEKVRQRFFVRGLDSSDREVGVFNSYGVACYQPYSAVINDYLACKNLFVNDQPKYAINGSLVPDELKSLVGVRKVRAQSGDTNSGILGEFKSLYMYQDELKNLFVRVTGLENSWLNNFIDTGRYRVKK
tara:strand:- start:12 stop:587 length:576 start_codon:yes stop_codon:yes gene_type:complete